MAKNSIPYSHPSQELGVAAGCDGGRGGLSSADCELSVGHRGEISGAKMILMRGLPHFVQMLAPVLSSEDLCFQPSGVRRDFFTLRQFVRARAVYYISGSATRSRSASLALLLRKPVIMHWVGTDVLNALSDHAAGKLSRHLVRSCVHWSEVPWTAQELASVGIQAEVVPLSSVIFPSQIPPLPKQFTILTYLGSRPPFYGFEILRRLAKDFPQVPIRVLGDCGLRQEEVPENMRLLGFVQNMPDQYAQSTLHIRMTQHDGLSFMVLEALAHGRHVIWTYPFEGACCATDYPGLRQHVADLFALHQQGQLSVNEQGAQFVRREYAPEKVAANLRRRMMELIDS